MCKVDFHNSSLAFLAEDFGARGENYSSSNSRHLRACADQRSAPTARFYWQASQASGFSSEQAMASSGLNTLAGAAALTVVLAILVAGRERR